MRRLLRAGVRGGAMVWCIGMCAMWLLCCSGNYSPKFIVWAHRTQVFIVFHSAGLRVVVEQDARPEAVRMRGIYARMVSTKASPMGWTSGPPRWPLDTFEGELEGGLGEPANVGMGVGPLGWGGPPPFTAKVLRFAGFEAAWGDGLHPLFSYVEATFQGAIIVPYWMLAGVPALLWAVPLGLWVWRFVKAPKRNMCGCGYDLRASPERCPECGRKVRGTVQGRTEPARELRRMVGTLGRWAGPLVGVTVMVGVWVLRPAEGVAFERGTQGMEPGLVVAVPRTERVQGVEVPAFLSTASSTEQPGK